ncbi:unnamed protein product [Lampetra planeri]
MAATEDAYPPRFEPEWDQRALKTRLDVPETRQSAARVKRFLAEILAGASEPSPPCKVARWHPNENGSGGQERRPQRCIGKRATRQIRSAQFPEAAPSRRSEV